MVDERFKVNAENNDFKLKHKNSTTLYENEDKKEEETDDAIFEQLMSYIGMDGKFQSVFNYSFNLVYVFFVSMPCMSIFMILAIPNHWCHVPGRDGTNYTIEDWREITIPRTLNDSDQITFSQCHMYNVESLLNSSFISLNGTTKNLETVKCENGWEYDNTYYQSTAPSQEDWVCDNKAYASNILSVSRIGDIVGTFVMGQLGDIIGRQRVFFISMILLVAGNTISVFTAHYYLVFTGVIAITSFAMTAVFQTPLILGIEISASDATAKIAMMQCIGWTAGLSVMPFVYWAVGDWRIFILAVSLPPLIFLFTWRVFPESPRWLAATGKTSKCIKSLTRIAKVNEKQLPSEAVMLIYKLSKKKENAYGLASLFSSWRLAKNTIILSMCWLVNFLVYNVIIINTSNMSGNPYMNFFYQAVVELPGYIIGKYCSENVGRRCTQIGFFFCSFVLHIVLVFVIKTITAGILMLLWQQKPKHTGLLPSSESLKLQECFLCDSFTHPIVNVQNEKFGCDPDLQWLSSITMVLIKLCVCIVGYSAYIQSMEIFPTCVRQTGCSTCALVSSVLGAVAPYIVLLGTSTDIRYTYIIMVFVTMSAVIVAFFLPETKDQKLPETLKEAASFGKHQKYWKIIQDPTISKDKSHIPLNEKC